MTWVPSFLPAENQSVSAAKSASGAILGTIYSLGMDTWSSYEKLFQSLAVSILLYGVQTWGINFLDSLEKVQLSFIKNLLSLSINTLNYAVTLETGSLHLSHRVLTITLNWICKIPSMAESRFPRQYFEKLREIALGRHGARPNWFSHLRAFFEGGDQPDVWRTLSLDTACANREAILRDYELFLRSRDRKQYIESSSLLVYPHPLLQNKTQQYLFLRLSLHFKKYLHKLDF